MGTHHPQRSAGTDGRVKELRCVLCGRTYAFDEHLYTCPVDGIGGILDVVYDDEAIRATGFGPGWLAANPDRSIWRYRPLLPIGEDAVLPPVQVGWTPLFPLPSLARTLDVAELWIKDDGRNPTASFKDRASSVTAVRAKELGFEKVCAASTGNAASSFACFATQLGLECFIFVPRSAPEAKVAQLLVFGATVFVVEGDYGHAFDLCRAASDAFGWYDRSAAINPIPVEGKKTAGHEIAEQTAADPPDWVSVSVGDGCTIAGIWKGMEEMRRFGVLPRLPKLLATQARGADPLVQAAQAGTDSWMPQEADTLADSISVGNPRNGIKALRAVRASGGAFISVEDEAILQAESLLARHGVFGEPAGVAGIAGIGRARRNGLIQPDERVLHVVTGNGLKDTKGAVRAAGREALRVEPSLDAVRAALGASA
jgi:threonine synthase